MSQGPFLRAVAEAEQIAQPETVDVRAELVQRWSAMRQFAPALLEAFAFEGAASASGLLKAVSPLQDMNQAGKRTLPGNALLGFIRRGWRPFEHHRRLEGRLSIIGANAPAPTPRFRVSPRAVTSHRRR